MVHLWISKIKKILLVLLISVLELGWLHYLTSYTMLYHFSLDYISIANTQVTPLMQNTTVIYYGKPVSKLFFS